MLGCLNPQLFYEPFGFLEIWEQLISLVNHIGQFSFLFRLLNRQILHNSVYSSDFGFQGCDFRCSLLGCLNPQLFYEPFGFLEIREQLISLVNHIGQFSFLFRLLNRQILHNSVYSSDFGFQGCDFRCSLLGCLNPQLFYEPFGFLEIREQLISLVNHIGQFSFLFRLLNRQILHNSVYSSDFGFQGCDFRCSLLGCLNPQLFYEPFGFLEIREQLISLVNHIGQFSFLFRLLNRQILHNSVYSSDFGFQGCDFRCSLLGCLNPQLFYEPFGFLEIWEQLISLVNHIGQFSFLFRLLNRQILHNSVYSSDFGFQGCDFRCSLLGCLNPQLFYEPFGFLEIWEQLISLVNHIGQFSFIFRLLNRQILHNSVYSSDFGFQGCDFRCSLLGCLNPQLFYEPFGFLEIWEQLISLVNHIGQFSFLFRLLNRQILHNSVYSSDFGFQGCDFRCSLLGCLNPQLFYEPFGFLEIWEQLISLVNHIGQFSFLFRLLNRQILHNSVYSSDFGFQGCDFRCSLLGCLNPQLFYEPFGFLEIREQLISLVNHIGQFSFLFRLLNRQILHNSVYSSDFGFQGCDFRCSLLGCLNPQLFYEPFGFLEIREQLISLVNHIGQFSFLFRLLNRQILHNSVYSSDFGFQGCDFRCSLLGCLNPQLFYEPFGFLEIWEQLISLVNHIGQFSFLFRLLNRQILHNSVYSSDFGFQGCDFRCSLLGCLNPQLFYEPFGFLEIWEQLISLVNHIGQFSFLFRLLNRQILHNSVYSSDFGFQGCDFRCSLLGCLNPQLFYEPFGFLEIWEQLISLVNHIGQFSFIFRLLNRQILHNSVYSSDFGFQGCDFRCSLLGCLNPQLFYEPFGFLEIREQLISLVNHIGQFSFLFRLLNRQILHNSVYSSDFGFQGCDFRCSLLGCLNPQLFYEPFGFLEIREQLISLVNHIGQFSFLFRLLNRQILHNSVYSSDFGFQGCDFRCSLLGCLNPQLFYEPFGFLEIWEQLISLVNHIGQFSFLFRLLNRQILHNSVYSSDFGFQGCDFRCSLLGCLNPQLFYEPFGFLEIREQLISLVNHISQFIVLFNFFSCIFFYQYI